MERIFSWFCALRSGEYRMNEEYDRTLIPVKAKIDPGESVLLIGGDAGSTRMASTSALLSDGTLLRSGVT